MSNNNITHGGGTIYYTQNRVLYASGEDDAQHRQRRHVDFGRPGQHVVRVWRRQDALHGQILRGNQPYSSRPKPTARPGLLQHAEVSRRSVRDGLRRGQRHHVLVELDVGVWALKVGDGSPVAPAPAVDGGACPPSTSTTDGGKPGTGGSSGTGGATGAGGSVGAGGGNSNAGGSGVVTGGSGGAETGLTTSGSGGSSNPGSAAGGASNIDDNGAPASTADAGCACRATSPGTTENRGVIGAILLLGLVLARRRPRSSVASV